jgi:tryptophan synthase alpha chain
MLDSLFRNKDKRALYIPYLSLGDPDRETSLQLAGAMIEAGADILELGIPFSDPVADGPVIQSAFSRALANEDINFETCLEMTTAIHKKYPDTPLLFLLYANLVFHYGLENMIQYCQENGVAGLVIPDLPFDSVEGKKLTQLGKERGVSLIHLVTPQTTPERQQQIGADNTGFIYFVSSYGVTGSRSTLSEELPGWVAACQKHTSRPVAVGFGISSPEQASHVAGFADGVIVGSANHKIIEGNLEDRSAMLQQLASYSASMVKACH